MGDELRHAIARAESDKSVVGIVITGAGRGFCAGADLKGLQAITVGDRERGKAPSDLEADPGDGFAWYRLGACLQAEGQLDAAIDAARHAAAFADVRSDALYNLACGLALQGHADDAIASLQQAVAAGFKAKWLLDGDPDLASIRPDPRFQKIASSL